MNETMITTGKVNTEKVLKKMTAINSQLVQLTQQLYNTKLNEQQVNKVCAMSYIDKLWLIAQYRSDLRLDGFDSSIANLNDPL